MTGALNPGCRPCPLRGLAATCVFPRASSRTRTHDIPIKSRALYQLSYGCSSGPPASRVGIRRRPAAAVANPDLPCDLGGMHGCGIAPHPCTARPWQDSNLRSGLRRAVLYPLSYRGLPG